MDGLDSEFERELPDAPGVQSVTVRHQWRLELEDAPP